MLSFVINKRVFQNIFIFVNILTFGGTPYFICIILNHIDRAPWPLYSIAFLFIACTSSINSIMLLITITNDQVKGILLAKLTGHQINAQNNRRATRNNQIVPFSTKMRTIQTLPTIY